MSRCAVEEIWKKRLLVFCGLKLHMQLYKITMNSKYDLHSCLPIYLQTILNQIQIHYNTVLLWRLSDKSILYLYVCSQLKPEQKRYQLHVLYFVTCVIVTHIWCWSTLLSHWINEESFNMPVSYKLSPVVHVTIISNSLILKFQFNIY